MSARDRILQRLQQAAVWSALSVPTPELVSVISSPISGEEMQARFAEALQASGATCHVVRNPVEARLYLVGWVQALGADEVLGWAPAEVGVPGLETALQNLGITWTVPEVHPGKQAETPAGWWNASLGITGADAAIATTGTLVLRSGPGRPRVASLFPAMHLAVVFTSALFPTLEAWLANWRPPADTSAATVTLISGPSRTLAIEMTPVFGMHGPRRLHVVLVESEESPI